MQTISPNSAVNFNNDGVRGNGLHATIVYHQLIKVDGGVLGNSLYTTLYAYLFKRLVRAKRKGREIFAKLSSYYVIIKS